MIDVFVYKRDDYFARGTVWGLSINNKDRFIELFQEEKGAWPEGRKFDEVRKQFGPYIPSIDDVVDNIDAFKSDKNLFGGILLGDIYSHYLGRKLGFEIFPAFKKEINSSSPVQKAMFYPTSMIGQLLELRTYILGETSGALSVEGSDPAYKLGVVERYVNGFYADGWNILMNPSIPTIELLRKIGVSEQKNKD